MTFGFDSAVACVTDALDRLHSTAMSHKRLMVLEVMGRHAGWIALFGGIAGGDIILLPKIPFEWAKVANAVRRRDADGYNALSLRKGRSRRTANNPTIIVPMASIGSAASERS
jgi:ATP-dependent phosphofructokinase / diphosphate-dependent phosphofructokinase